MGWWSTLEGFLHGVAASIATAGVGAMVAVTLAILSATFLIAAVIVIAIAVTIILVDEFGFPKKVEEDYPNYAVTSAFVYHASIIHLHDVHYCSGAFIGTYFILTVAQCVYTFVNNQIGKSKMKVYVGIRQVPSYFEFGYAIDKITIHPKFTAHRLAYNIAVLKLTEKVTESYFAKPITLPSATMKLENTTVLVSGFRNLNAPTVQTNMTNSVMTIIEYIIYHRHFYRTILTELKFCVIPSYGWKSCQASRGSTAANNDGILIGLFVAENPVGCAKNLPEIFVDVTKFLEFIKDATK